MTLRGEVADSFKEKGLKFVSLSESLTDPQKTTLVYVDASGKTVSKEITMRLSELEDTISALDAMDPADLANYLLS